MEADAKVTISADASQLAPVLAELRELVERSTARGELAPAELDLLDEPSQLVCFDVDGSASPAGELRVLLQPTDRLLELVAALRAWDRDRCGVEHDV
jgi:hypothetical protein